MKKQIAVLMAAATAVTTVAPVLASADTTNYEASVSEINAKIKDALNTRYKNKTEDGINASNANNVDDYLNSRYAVILYIEGETAELNGTYKFAKSKYDISKIINALEDGVKDKEDVFGRDTSKTGYNLESNLYVVKNASDVQNVIENKVIGSPKTTVKVAIVDKGIKDGSAVETIKDKHYVTKNSDIDTDTEVSLTELVKGLATSANAQGNTYVDKLEVNGSEMTLENAKTATGVTKVKLTLKSGKEFTLEENDKAFDLTKPLDKDKKELTLGDGVAQNIYDQVEGFEFIENEDDKEVTLVLPCGDTDVYNLEDVETSTIELGKIFTTKDGYTKEGADLINGIIDAKNYKNKSIEFNYRGVNYTLATKAAAISINENDTEETVKKKTLEAFSEQPENAIEKSGNGYVLRYNVFVVNSSDKDSTPTKLQFVIKGDSQKDLAIVRDDLNGENTVVSGHFTRLEGANRYETAIEVSKEKFKPNEAKSVVIVGGDALMDGLSAVPLASVKTAPILLSSKNGLSDATLNEIDRACDDLYRKTVYVVGGENSVPEKAVKQLEERFGVVVMRVSGSDRYDTSLEVAKRLKYDGQMNEKIYLAGGEGAADAMSISPVAATVNNKKVSPVLVVPKNSLKRSTREFITETGEFTEGHIIGGEATVSSNVYRALAKANKSTILPNKLDRVAGSDRYDTNIELLKKFYTNGKDKDGNEEKDLTNGGEKILVKGAVFTSGDTKFLVDAQTAGPLAAKEGAPIVLTGAKLTDDQVKLLKKNNNGLLSKVNTNVYQVGGVVSSDVMSVVVDKLGL